MAAPPPAAIAPAAASTAAPTRAPTLSSTHPSTEPAGPDNPDGPDGPDSPTPDRIVARPDGFHWLASDGRQEFGPFDTIEAALADLQASDEEGPEPAETLAEAEAEIGIADWIDPETGGPAEGGCPPHIEDR